MQDLVLSKEDGFGCPLVSVAIPAYNHGQFVRDCILSVISQSYERIELIVIDDGSTDDTASVIRELTPQCLARFVRFEFRTRENRGLCATLNECLSWCKGDYYSAIASDDLMLSNKTSAQVAHLEKNPLCNAVFGGIQILDANGELSRVVPGRGRLFSFDEMFVLKSYVYAPAQMLRLSAIKEEGYPSGLYVDDLYMWLKISKKGLIFELNDVVACYRKWEGNSSKRAESMHRGRLQIMDEYKDHPLYREALSSAWLQYAAELQTSRKLKSLLVFCQLIAKNLQVLKRKKALKWLVRFFVPKKFL